MRRLIRAACPNNLGPASAGEKEFKKAYKHFIIEGNASGFDFSAYSEKNVKEALHSMSEGMCAYCESRYDATQPVDVEHFRPKGRIDTQAGKVQPAYWWLAASWSNLLPSCIDCNREREQILFDGSMMMMGKADRFPLLDESTRANAIGDEAHEVPLLLDPTNDEPTHYLRFVTWDEKCIIEPIHHDLTKLDALRGRTSIDTYGLNRRGLVADRSRYMVRIKASLVKLERLAQRLEKAAPEHLQEIEEDVLDEMTFLRSHVNGEDRFTGLARCLVEPVLTKLGLTL